MLKAKRRFDRPVDKLGRINWLWLKMWKIIYQLVSVFTYVVTVVCLISCTYYVFVNYNVIMATSTGLLALLMAKVNQLTP